MGARREQRVKAVLTVHISGMDRSGKCYAQEAKTLDVTPVGARIAGITSPVEAGSNVCIRCGKSQSRFRVLWVGETGTARAGQIGVQALEVGKYIWGVALPRMMGDEGYEETPGEVPPAHVVAGHKPATSPASTSTATAALHVPVQRSRR